MKIVAESVAASFKVGVWPPRRSRVSPPPRRRQAEEEHFNKALSIVVVGASGDLAKKKTYPSLYALWKMGVRELGAR